MFLLRPRLETPVAAAVPSEPVRPERSELPVEPERPERSELPEEPVRPERPELEPDELRLAGIEKLGIAAPDEPPRLLRSPRPSEEELEVLEPVSPSS